MSESKLYRSLAGLTTTRPLFTVTSAGRTWTDPSILGITITHGKGDPEGGLHPATCEVEVTGAVGILHDRHMTVRLSDAAATALTGGTAAAPRFTGRVATQRVTTHPVRGRGPRHTSVLRASSWSALYLAAGRAPLISPPMLLSEMLQRMFTRSATWVGRSIPLTFTGGWGDWFYGDGATSYTASFSELIGKHFAEPGFLLRQLRDGTVQGMALSNRAGAGETAAETWWPITLGHAIGAVEHEQQLDVADVGVTLSRREPSESGDVLAPRTITVKWAWPGSDDGVPSSAVADWVEYDWTHTVWTTEQYRHAINAISSRTFRVAFSTPTITVDLLALARSGTAYDLTMLRQLLRLEQGDPVVFGGDWSAQWNGIYYAERITERITPSAWTLELALFAPPEVTGHYGRGGAPMPPARTWGQHTFPWSSTTKDWN